MEQLLHIQIDSVTGWCGKVGYGARLSEDLAEPRVEDENIKTDDTLRRGKKKKIYCKYHIQY